MKKINMRKSPWIQTYNILNQLYCVILIARFFAFGIVLLPKFRAYLISFLMSKNIQSLSKWMPLEILDDRLYRNCRELKYTCLNLIRRIFVVVSHLRSQWPGKNESELQIQDIEDVCTTLETLVEKFFDTFSNLKADKSHHQVINIRFKMFREMLWNVKLKFAYVLQNYISQIAHLFVHYGDHLLILSLRTATSYNSFISMDKKFNLNTGRTNICTNTCPYLMFPLKKFSITRMLQILASSRAEMCCHKLIDCLLETYNMYDNDADDDQSSDNSSLEIYMALTKHMSPCNEMTNQMMKEDSIENIDQHPGNFSYLDELIVSEETNVINLLNIAINAAPSMLGDGIIKSKNMGVAKIRKKSQVKVLEYYEQILWAEVGNYLEHVILWWAPSSLFARSPHSSQHLREWINQFLPTVDVSPSVSSALMSLADGLGVYVTSTSWDENFRMALVASKAFCNSDTGKLFTTVLQDLVALCNQCEVTPDWVMGAPLDELPLVEQIPVFHRLDHSVHTIRLWAENECKKLANNWNVKSFFAITHRDIVECLNQLKNLRLNDHTPEIDKGGLGVHVEVCALMRAKLVSEVKVNIEKLANTPRECVNGLASICKTISLANLKMIFPTANHWKQGRNDMPEAPSAYVEKYLNQILTPILKATDDQIICNMILTLICESWLDHIYQNKIHFSKYGAYQLLCDFSYISTWIKECQFLTEYLRKKLIKNEVLRRCEGVGKLLLRNPGERLKMVDKRKRRKSVSDNSSEDGKGEQMPAEMYVPNQEQWLELRATRKSVIFRTPPCCGKN